MTRRGVRSSSAATWTTTGRRILRLKGGATIFNSYPVRYFEPGTKRVANPEGGAPPAPPVITTPPLTTDAARAERRR